MFNAATKDRRHDQRAQILPVRALARELRRCFSGNVKPQAGGLPMKFALTTAAAAALSVTFVFGSVASSEAAKKKAPAKDPVATFLCPLDYTPVCGTLNKKKVTFGNACQAKQAGATGVKKGACKK
jgi:hypothetical protein